MKHILFILFIPFYCYSQTITVPSDNLDSVQCIIDIMTDSSCIINTVGENYMIDVEKVPIDTSCIGRMYRNNVTFDKIQMVLKVPIAITSEEFNSDYYQYGIDTIGTNVYYVAVTDDKQYMTLEQIYTVLKSDTSIEILNVEQYKAIRDEE